VSGLFVLVPSRSSLASVNGKIFDHHLPEMGPQSARVNRRILKKR
jgi:hypothetical protein